MGYGTWRKDESTRLAAAEINNDISKLEVFQKPDPELLAENKRLRAMLAEREAATPITDNLLPHEIVEASHHPKKNHAAASHETPHPSKAKPHAVVHHQQHDGALMDESRQRA